MNARFFVGITGLLATVIFSGCDTTQSQMTSDYNSTYQRIINQKHQAEELSDSQSDNPSPGIDVAKIATMNISLLQSNALLKAENAELKTVKPILATNTAMLDAHDRELVSTSTPPAKLSFCILTDGRQLEDIVSHHAQSQVLVHAAKGNGDEFVERKTSAKSISAYNFCIQTKIPPMIAYERHTELLSKHIHGTITAQEKADLEKC